MTKKDPAIAKFPPVTELSVYHELLDQVADAVGDDPNNPPTAISVLLIQGGEIEQFSLAPGTNLLQLLGAVEVQRETLLAALLYPDED